MSQKIVNESVKILHESVWTQLYIAGLPRSLFRCPLRVICTLKRGRIGGGCGGDASCSMSIRFSNIAPSSACRSNFAVKGEGGKGKGGNNGGSLMDARKRNYTFTSAFDRFSVRTKVPLNFGNTIPRMLLLITSFSTHLQHSFSQPKNGNLTHPCTCCINRLIHSSHSYLSRCARRPSSAAGRPPGGCCPPRRGSCPSRRSPPGS